MAFDRNNTTQLQSLYDERTLDPLAIGYAANDNQFVRQINDPDGNPGGETVAKTLNAEALLDVISTSDFASNQVDQGERDWLKMCFDYALQGNDIEKYRAKIKGIFQANSSTNTAIDALVRPLSRAEVLFGANTILVVDDWLAARRFVEGA